MTELWSERTTESQIGDMAQMLDIPLVAVCCKNELKKLPTPTQIGLEGLLRNQRQSAAAPSESLRPQGVAYVINLQDTTDGFGTHWVCLWLENKTEPEAAYFDSFGLPPPIDVIKFCERAGCHSGNTFYSDVQIQQVEESYCGQFCMDFLKAMNGKGTLEKKYDKFIKKYQDI
jgi:hypothetical protein